MYRVIKKGEFNTSFSYARSPPAFVRENIIDLSKLFNYFDVKFECVDFFDLKFEECVLYLDPPYYENSRCFDEYCANSFNHKLYVDRLNEIRSNNSVHLLHSNSKQFLDIYNNDKRFDLIIYQDRMNSKNMKNKRIELLFY